MIKNVSKVLTAMRNCKVFKISGPLNRQYVPKFSIISKPFCVKDQKLLADFKNILESEKESDYDSRIKLLSLELLQKESSSDVISLFEEYYLKSLIPRIYGEELALIIYFYLTLMEKEIKKPDYKINDDRFDNLLKLLNERLKELDIVNLLAVCWAINIGITRFDLYLPIQYKIDIIDQLPNELPVEKHGEIPTICYSISNFMDNKKNPSEQELYNLLEQKANNKITVYSSLFFGESGLIYNNILNISLMFICWTKINYDNHYIMENAIKELKSQEVYLTLDNLEEILKIMWASSLLNFKSKTLQDICESYFEKNIKEASMEKIIDGLLSVSSISPENINLINVFIEGFKDRIRNNELVDIDITSFVNLFLGLSKIHLNNPTHKDLRLIVSYLLHLYDKKNYLTVKNMENDEICSLMISFSVLMVWESKILDEILSYIKNNHDKFNNNQLIQLASSGKYIFSLKNRHTELYKLIHDACVNSKHRFNDNQIKILRKIFKDDGIINNSIFV